MRRFELAALIAVPVVYYCALIIGSMTYPGYSHVTRYASELGAVGATYPGFFNACIVAAGAAALIGAAGLAATLRDLSGRWLWAAPAGLALALWGAAMVMGGWFPMPDERHGGFGLGLAAPAVPLFTCLALWRVPGSGPMRAFLVFIFIGQVVLLAIMFGVGRLVTLQNLGVWQRINSAFAIIWLAELGFWLLRHRTPPEAAPSSAKAHA